MDNFNKEYPVSYRNKKHRHPPGGKGCHDPTHGDLDKHFWIDACACVYVTRLCAGERSQRASFVS